MPSENDVLNELKKILDPDLKQDIVSLGFVKNLEIKKDHVRFDVELTTPACPVKEQLKAECFERVRQIPGVSKVEVTMTSNTRARANMSQGAVLPDVKNVIAVASGKGGVGKSTVAANLALALSKSGASVGLLDADIYGPSIPLMFGINRQPNVSESGQMIPLESLGIKLMSMGFLSNDDTPVIWRGPMVHGILQQFLTRVDWGKLDYLVMDLPPGTGDAQLSLTQSAPISGAVIVTTPQEVSLIDARKGLKMFQKVKVPVLGIIENMSYFVCSDCGTRTNIFRTGGGERTAKELGVPFLGEIPIDAEVAEAGDSGIPIIAKNPNARVAKAYQETAGKIAAQLSIVNMLHAKLPGDFKMTWKTVPSK